MLCSPYNPTATTTLYVASCTLAISPLLLLLAATAYVLYGSLLCLAVLALGVLSVVGFVLHCVMAAQNQLENNPMLDVPGKLAEFEGCVVRQTNPQICVWDAPATEEKR